MSPHQGCRLASAKQLGPGHGSTEEGGERKGEMGGMEGSGMRLAGAGVMPGCWPSQLPCLRAAQASFSRRHPEHPSPVGTPSIPCAHTQPLSKTRSVQARTLNRQQFPPCSPNLAATSFPRCPEAFVCSFQLPSITLNGSIHPAFRRRLHPRRGDPSGCKGLIPAPAKKNPTGSETTPRPEHPRFQGDARCDAWMGSVF